MGEQRGRAREQSRRERSEAELGVQPLRPAVLALPVPPPLEPPCCAKLTLLPPETATEAGVVRSCCKLPLPESLPGLPLHGSVTSHLCEAMIRAAGNFGLREKDFVTHLGYGICILR
ncbi:uncharacterized protein DS421_2g44130 [Arachis hypogaea]|nr:uncharacterized protein DS421_2g44130 [Arachis hypogaea]